MLAGCGVRQHVQYINLSRIEIFIGCTVLVSASFVHPPLELFILIVYPAPASGDNDHLDFSLAQKSIYKVIFYCSNDKLFYYPPLAGEAVRLLNNFKWGWTKKPHRIVAVQVSDTTEA